MAPNDIYTLLIEVYSSGGYVYFRPEGYYSWIPGSRSQTISSAWAKKLPDILTGLEKHLERKIEGDTTKFQLVSLDSLSAIKELIDKMG
jgi:hypothetical protein